MPVSTGLNFCWELCSVTAYFTIIYVCHVILLLVVVVCSCYSNFIKNARLHDSKLFN